MEAKDKFKIALTIACFAAISIVLSNKYRKYKKRKQSANDLSCYLKTESKPQHIFQRVLADNSYAPFKHLKLHESISDDSSNLHPYEAEIMELIKNPTIEFEFGNADTDMEMSGSYVWVETEAKLQELADALSKERVFGVDTEQHSLRSFLGFTALVQISTGNEDYLVDTIALHDVMGILRPVFANPGICKVFHGADNDVVWLQIDFHIYVVNLFDTAKACDILLKPQKSLAYLLESYCGVTTNKLLQREDWRQRPLPAEMVQYARMDAHYLLYIADCLMSELKNQENDNSACVDDKFHFLLEASRRSNAVCLQSFSKEIEASPGESAASSIISRRLNDQGSTVPIFSNSKFHDFVRRICCWRDLMARVHDESLRYVLSDHAVSALAEKVPKTEDDIYDTISLADLDVDSMNPSSSLQSPSSIIWSHCEDLLDLFQDEIGKLDDLFELILTKHLGPNGTCTLSLYNYGLLSKRNLKAVNRSVSKENGFKVAKRVTRKASRELFVQKFSCKAPVYHNCRIYANDGRLLCYCDRKKLEWYLSRDLAKIVDEKPPAIMLLFEPKGHPEDEGNDFYIQSKKNICVGCGEGNHYLRYRIIPSCYRMHFPEHLKSHRSHDIVLVCVDCHEKAHAAAEKYKKQIAAEYGIPLFIRKVVDSTHTEDVSGSSTSVMNGEDAGVSPLDLRTAAMALLRHGPRMPSKRRDELTQVVIKYYGGREISTEDLERALLVGMSPHERRRVEKKRGISLSRSTRNIISGKEPEDIEGIVLPFTSEGTLQCDESDGSHAIKEEIQIQEDRNIKVTESNVSSPSLCSDFGFCEEAPVTDSIAVKSDKNVACVAKSYPISDSDAHSVDRNPSNGTIDSVQTGATPGNHNSKLSPLGHGPHGKQVVDHLLKEYGDDGVRQFCQRWRQVFVETVNPRFLPGGWDVAHRDAYVLGEVLTSFRSYACGNSIPGFDTKNVVASGRREFGEFSVYNPANKAHPPDAVGVEINEATEDGDKGGSS